MYTYILHHMSNVLIVQTFQFSLHSVQIYFYLSAVAWHLFPYFTRDIGMITLKIIAPMGCVSWELKMFHLKTRWQYWSLMVKSGNSRKWSGHLVHCLESVQDCWKVLAVTWVLDTLAAWVNAAVDDDLSIACDTEIWGNCQCWQQTMPALILSP